MGSILHDLHVSTGRLSKKYEPKRPKILREAATVKLVSSKKDNGKVSDSDEDDDEVECGTSSSDQKPVVNRRRKRPNVAKSCAKKDNNQSFGTAEGPNSSSVKVSRNIAKRSKNKENKLPPKSKKPEIEEKAYRFPENFLSTDQPTSGYFEKGVQKGKLGTKVDVNLMRSIRNAEEAEDDENNQKNNNTKPTKAVEKRPLSALKYSF